MDCPASVDFHIVICRVAGGGLTLRLPQIPA